MGKRRVICVCICWALINVFLSACTFDQSSPSSNLAEAKRSSPETKAEPSSTPAASLDTSGASSAAKLPTVEPKRGVSSVSMPASTPNTALSQSPDIVIPVEGVRPGELRDTFQDARSEGRRHDAIDIPAPHNTPVLAAGDGKIVKLFHSERGGTTIYELLPDNRTVYYYAHLDHYADGVAEGQSLRKGDVIAYVGDTGDAGPGNYHLHFSISIVSDPKRYWDGANIDPYPLLHK